MAPIASGYRLSTLSGRQFSFDAGALSFEFATTGGEGPRKARETIHTPADLAAWAARSRLGAGGAIDPDEVTFRRRDLIAVSELREAIWFAGTELAHSRRPRPADLAVLNKYAARAPMVPMIDVSYRTGRSWVTPLSGAQLLSSVARDAIEVFTGPMAARIRQCEGPTCALIFVDTSRPGRRRWCSMDRCGNLDKQRAFRRRSNADP